MRDAGGMDDTWRWVIGVGVTLLAAGLGWPAFLYYRKQLRPATASLHTNRLLIAQADVPELELSFREQALTKPSLVEIVLECGRSDVPPSAFEGGTVHVRTSKGRLLHAFGGTPEQARWTREGDANSAAGFTVQLEPLLLKAGERCEIKLLCDGDLGDLEQTVRLKDVKQVKNAAPNTQQDPRALSVTAAAVAAASGTAAISMALSNLVKF